MVQLKMQDNAGAPAGILGERESVSMDILVEE